MAAFTARAQTPGAQEFNDKYNALYEKLIQTFSEKNYAAAEKYCTQLIDLFDAQSAEVQQQYQFYKPANYYNLSCTQSILGKRKAAVKNFEKACQSGFDDYGRVLRDTDFDNIRNDKTFLRLLAAMRETSDYLHILKTTPGYKAEVRADTLPQWVYSSPNDRDLVRIREYFKLDSVAGAGGELSKIQRILTYIHDKILHDGNNQNPPTMNSIALAEACKDGSRGLNCRGLATVLNECYLAMGFKSRFVTCMPKIYITDCHVINTVYSATLDKWVWVDPTQNAWVMDENGVMLSIAEVRERLRDGRTLVLNDTANWNNQKKATKEDYLDNYMAKNLYCIYCSDRSEVGTEVYDEQKPALKYTFLCPEGFKPEYPYSRVDYVTTDDAWFWQSPYKK